MLDCIHIVYKKFFSPLLRAHRQQFNFIAPKFLAKNQDRITNAGLYSVQCTHILEFVPSPTQGLTGQQTTVQLNNLPNVWHGYQDEIINVGLYKPFRNFSLPHSGHTDNSFIAHKFLAKKSG